MDFEYYSYLARTIPPREIARALAVRARRALGVPAVFLDSRNPRPSTAVRPAREAPVAQIGAALTGS